MLDLPSRENHLHRRCVETPSEVPRSQHHSSRLSSSIAAASPNWYFGIQAAKIDSVVPPHNLHLRPSNTALPAANVDGMCHSSRDSSCFGWPGDASFLPSYLRMHLPFIFQAIGYMSSIGLLLSQICLLWLGSTLRSSWLVLSKQNCMDRKENWLSGINVTMETGIRKQCPKISISNKNIPKS